MSTTVKTGDKVWVRPGSIGERLYPHIRGFVGVVMGRFLSPGVDYCVVYFIINYQTFACYLTFDDIIVLRDLK